MFRRLGLAALVFSAACGDEPLFTPAGPNAAPDPAEYGPYPVGVRTVELIDVSRMTMGYSERRRITTEVWYPAVEADRGGSHAKYYVGDALPQKIVDRLGDLKLAYLETYAVRGAEVRREGAPFPVILFSHGSGGVRFQSTHLTAALASHGYIVLAPDHEGNTLRDLLNAEEIIPSDFLVSYQDRPRDLIFIHDWLRDAPEAADLREAADLSRVGAVGHSLGSITALRTAGIDPRIDVAIAQAPAGYLATWLDVGRPLADLNIPVMLQVAGIDRTLPPEAHADTLWAELARPRFRADFPTGGHFTFSDLCTLDLVRVAETADLGVGNVLEDGCGPENIPSITAFPLIRRTAIGLLNAVLRASPASLNYVSTVENEAGQAEMEVVSEP